jgi:cytochrome c oxidase assembly factor CtaG
MRRLTRLILGPAALWLAAPAPAFAHEGESHGAGWTLTPWVTLPLLATALLYLVGYLRLRQRSGRGRPSRRQDAWLFAAGWLTLAGALVSPLHEGGERSFTLHMIEHEILMLVSALLIVASRPGAALLWAFPPRVRQGFGAAGRWPLWHVLTDPFVATALQAVAIIGWHVPWLFDLALRNEGWHVAQHLSFIGTGLLFWWAMIHSRTGRGGYLVSALCLFVTSMVGGGLGALMTLADSPWYAGYAALGMTPAGLTPEQDQQLAGLLMWVPGGLYHLVAALWFLSRALQEGRHAVPTA